MLLHCYLLVPLLLVACGSGGDALGGRDAEEVVSDAAPPPLPPAGLTRWLVGNAADKVATPQRGLILMGGGTDVDAAYAWQRDRIDGGDVVILRASGADGYNDYLLNDVGGVDSVETLLIANRTLADDPYVAWTLGHAEAIYLAGGDQSVYVASWQGTAIEAALRAAWDRGAVLGGTSAGCAVLGELGFSAEQGSITSPEALADPYDPLLTLASGLPHLDVLAGVITDTHFAERDRMGRLLAFLARARVDHGITAPLGLGIDEATAIVVDEVGIGTVLGSGAAYLVAPTTSPAQCSAGQPLTWADVSVVALHAGDTVTLPGGATSVAASTLSAQGGVLIPSDPY